MIGLFLRELRLEHTLFALPFAYVGAVMAAHGHPTPAHLLWITLAVFGARTAAMAANRLLDRRIDARNPRTAARGLADGRIPPSVAVVAIAAGLLLTLYAAYELNPLCVKLLPIAAAGVLLYPLCKRFTWLTHLVLGAVDGLAPLGAVVAVTGEVNALGLTLFLAVTLWVAGFDVLYALMDLEVDRAQGIFSFPARFGDRAARVAPLLLHGAMVALLAVAGRAAGVSGLYAAGLLCGVALIAYEARLVRGGGDVFALNDRVFRANMGFSVAFLAATSASLPPL